MLNETKETGQKKSLQGMEEDDASTVDGTYGVGCKLLYAEAKDRASFEAFLATVPTSLSQLRDRCQWSEALYQGRYYPTLEAFQADLMGFLFMKMGLNSDHLAGHNTKGNTPISLPECAHDEDYNALYCARDLISFYLSFDDKKEHFDYLPDFEKVGDNPRMLWSYKMFDMVRRIGVNGVKYASTKHPDVPRWIQECDFTRASTLPGCVHNGVEHKPFPLKDDETFLNLVNIRNSTPSDEEDAMDIQQKPPQNSKHLYGYMTDATGDYVEAVKQARSLANVLISLRTREPESFSMDEKCGMVRLLFDYCVHSQVTDYMRCFGKQLELSKAISTSRFNLTGEQQENFADAYSAIENEDGGDQAGGVDPSTGAVAKVEIVW